MSSSNGLVTLTAGLLKKSTLMLLTKHLWKIVVNWKICDQFATILLPQANNWQKFTNSISILKIRQKEKPLHSKGFGRHSTT